MPSRSYSMRSKHIMNFLFLATLLVALAHLADSVSTPFLIATELPNTP